MIWQEKQVRQGTAPCGYRIGRGDRRQRRQAPRRGHGGQGKPTTIPPCAPAGTANARRANAARVQVAGDARGEAPCIRKLKISPFPPGRGQGGWGQKIYDMAGKTGEAKGKPPCGCRNGKVSRRPTGQAPAGYHNGRVSRRPSPCVPPRAPLTPAEPMPRGFRSRECKGRSPLHKKTKNLPLPRRGRGSGGWGKEIKLKAG